MLNNINYVTFDARISLTNTSLSLDIELISAVDTLRVTVFNTSDTIRSIANNITGSSGYIDDARSIVRNGFDSVRNYDTPR